MKKIVIAFCMAVTGLACNNNKTNEKKSTNDLKDDVMAVHDDVMGKMSKIMQLKMQLKDSLAAKDSTSVEFASYKTQSVELQKQLEADDKGMMDWMSNYNEDTLSELGMEDGKVYLQDQKKQINKLKDNTNLHLKATEKFLNMVK